MAAEMFLSQSSNEPNVQSEAGFSSSQRSGRQGQTAGKEKTRASSKKRTTKATWREQCRINQARYRNRQRQREESLTERVRQLQEQVEDLRLGLKLRVIAKRQPANTNLWLVATEFFRILSKCYE
ncbi:uncharacterized protein PITG_15714 [Phytophthora infestans T30-4]|uniref:BZIP domain-containing protein n=1 Tax=Phytophthora infestans (strain T30-4) TaxID=403677 RepID=D0NSE2_PHYIT|nr:uncharacterized protein PITG_15714 [Phytophthora infestans T30-4]EEY64487.1 hypothetical protein PITG_15714 [Phytophthora infestans T30-4]|eukprot:XP_002897990.1 hypothetical protein PITG_15714 [Phytophthora infestans T30-4]